MVSGLEKRMLSGMLGLLSLGCAKAREVAPAKASVIAPATTTWRRETSVENCWKPSKEDGSVMLTAPATGAGSIAGERSRATAVNDAAGCRFAEDEERPQEGIRMALEREGSLGFVIPLQLFRWSSSSRSNSA